MHCWGNLPAPAFRSWQGTDAIGLSVLEIRRQEKHIGVLLVVNGDAAIIINPVTLREEDDGVVASRLGELIL